MKIISPDGRVFERITDSFVFTKSPLIILPGLTEYWIDGEEVNEKKFRKELETIFELWTTGETGQ